MAKDRKREHLNALAGEIRGCTKCPLHKSRTTAVPGDGPVSARVMLVGEAPGQEEDETGHPFVGRAGRFLDRILDEVGLDRDELFITNIVKCHPPENRAPRRVEVGTCTSQYLFAQIDLVDPDIIVLLGTTAARALLQRFTSLGDLRGRLIEEDGRMFLVAYHPAARFYREDLGDKIREDFHLLKRELDKR